MLQRPGLSDLSRRWRWALVVVAAVVIPMQLVARTPPVQSKTVVSPDGSRQAEIYLVQTDQATGEVLKLQEFQKKAVVVEKSGPSFDLYMFFKTFFEQSEKTFAVAEQERAVERQKVDDLKRRAAEEQNTKELDRGKVEMLKLIEAKAQAERARSEKQADDLKRRAIEMQKLVEARAQADRAKVEALRDDLKLKKAYFEIADEKRRRQETTESEQLRQLAERYQQLAAEARRLADEFERLQRQSVQPR